MRKLNYTFGHVSKQMNRIFITGNRPFYWIIVISLITYIKTVTYDFSPLDDSILIVSRLDWLKDFRNIFPIFTKPLYFGIGEFYYRPILITSFMIDAMLGGGSAISFHITNVVIHVIVSMLVYKLFLKFGLTVGSSFWFAIIFTVHPINLSAIAWIPGRNDSLLAIFVIASFICWIYFIETNKPIWLTAHYLWFGLSLLTKENAIVIPIMALVYYYIYSNNNRKFPNWRFIIGWGSITFTWILVRLSILDNPQQLDIQPMTKIVGNLAIIFSITFERLVFPIRQYVSPNLLDINPIPGVIFTVFVISTLLYLGVKDQKKALFGGLWLILFMIIPELWVSCFGIGYTYEHRLYIPLLGFLLILSQINTPQLISWKPIALLATVLIPITYFTKTFVRVDVYKNHENYSQAISEESPSMPFANEFRGDILSKSEQFEDAIPFYTKSLILDSTQSEIYLKRALAYENNSRYIDAVHDLNTSIRLNSENAQAYFNRAGVYRHLENLQMSLSDLNEAIQLDTSNSQYYNDRGLLYLNFKQFGDAIEDFSRSIQYNPSYSFAYHNRSAAYFIIGNYEAALADQILVEETGGVVNEDILGQIIYHLHKPE